MSRIHEALKKAAQERNAQLGGRSGPDLIDLEVQPVAVAPPSRIAEEHLEEAATIQPRDLRLATAIPDSPYEVLVSNCARPAWKMDARYNAFAPEHDDLLVAEKFRTLRSRLYQIAANQPLRSILVTSSVPAEGKTYVAANLALSFARQSDRRVLLLDADLRASRLHLHLGAPEKPGLSDYLCGGASESQVIQVGPQGNLCLIPGGTDVSNPVELLHSERMKELLERMTRVFDWVILDSPPAMAVHDASVLSDMCDGTLFVVRAGSTDFEIAEKACSEFNEKSLLGVVLNRVDRSATYGSYYYGYGTDKE